MFQIKQLRQQIDNLRKEKIVFDYLKKNNADQLA